MTKDEFDAMIANVARVEAQNRAARIRDGLIRLCSIGRIVLEKADNAELRAAIDWLEQEAIRSLP